VDIFYTVRLGLCRLNGSLLILPTSLKYILAAVRCLPRAVWAYRKSSSISSRISFYKPKAYRKGRTDRKLAYAAVIFWDTDDILLIDYILQKIYNYWHRIMAKYCDNCDVLSKTSRTWWGSMTIL